MILFLEILAFIGWYLYEQTPAAIFRVLRVGICSFFLTFVVSYFKMRKKKCCFHKCGLKNNSDRRVFHFRRHDYTLWAEICGIDITKMKINSIICNLVVCEWHFTSEDFRMIVSPLKYSSFLRREAVPRGMFAYQLVMI